MILVSSCLCGEKCKYSGGDNYNEAVIAYCQDQEVLQVCPEVLGGLPIPRHPAEIVGGSAKDVLEGRARILNDQGEDVTSCFLQGAKEVLKLAKIHQIKEAILKANSPSCGKGKVYNGEFKGELVDGNGVTAELLLQSGIQVKTEKSLK
ncbi:MAG: DUF523 domain-containing protein [Cellulosilyticum sp.]|nr:DUF523 domain-containing protein [Cellulosilyticum sp.]